MSKRHKARLRARRLRLLARRRIVEQPRTRYRVVLPAGMYRQIRGFLFSGNRLERFGVILAGVSHVDGEIRLLGREFIPAKGDVVVRASTGCVVVSSSFSQYVMRRCAETGLAQIDCHSHPFGGDDGLWFSGVDDREERIVAEYIYRHLPKTVYASLVFDEAGERGRVWLPGHPPSWQSIETMRLVESPLQDLEVGNEMAAKRCLRNVNDIAFDRHVRVFGEEGQARMKSATITVVGAGGLGGPVIEGLARLGFGRINIVDPDCADPTNLNRVVGMRFEDARRGTSKAQIAARMVQEINPVAQVGIFPVSVFEESVLAPLKQSDVIIVATDNHSTRLFCQRVAAHYLIPLLHVGVTIEAHRDRLQDVSGEYAFALPGPAGWCLSCAAAIDPQLASWELAPEVDQVRWVQRGYVQGANIPAPSVRHLNGVVADLALAEVHNLFSPYRNPRNYVSYDGLRCELIPINIERDPRCAICSESGVLGLGDLEPLPALATHKRISVPDPPVNSTDSPQTKEDKLRSARSQIAGYLTYSPRE